MFQYYNWSGIFKIITAFLSTLLSFPYNTSMSCILITNVTLAGLTEDNDMSSQSVNT